MDLQGQRDLQLLSEVERDPDISQRSLAKKLGVALGLTNLYLKRLAHKGYIKITTIPRKRIQYLLTPRGMAEKSRLTYEYMQYSLSYYREMREKLKHVLSDLSKSGAKRVVIYGSGELAELAYLSLREMDLTFVGCVDGKSEPPFLSYPIGSIESLASMEFDAVLIGELVNTAQIRSELMKAGVTTERIVSLVPH